MIRESTELGSVDLQLQLTHINPLSSFQLVLHGFLKVVQVLHGSVFERVLNLLSHGFVRNEGVSVCEVFWEKI